MSTFAIDVRVVARERAVFTVAQGEAIRPAVSLRGVKSHALTSNLAGVLKKTQSCDGRGVAMSGCFAGEWRCGIPTHGSAVVWL